MRIRTALRSSCISCLALLLLACSEPEPLSARHCFRNEFPIDGAKDVQELTVVIEGDRASGEYNWLPAFKDRRFGRFSGFMRNGVIEAAYDFRQEGRSDTTSIAIAIEADRALVSGGPPELGLNLVLQRVAC